MEYQPPANGIMIVYESPNSKMYRVNCECGNPDDDIIFEIEVNQSGVISVSTYTTQFTDHWSKRFKPNYKIENDTIRTVDWYSKDFINTIINKIKLTWQIWIKGHIKYEQSTIMNEQQALNYAKTLEHAIEELKKYRAGQ